VSDSVTREQTLAGELLAWYGANARDLPWRRVSDPYGVLVSEIMLQQTQVPRAASAWVAFVERFPTVAALAAASPADVLTAWAGLGYNRRAVNLHRAARVIMAEHDGRVPDDLDALRALPGVGEYTARAVLAFAFGQDAAPVDTNVARVLARAVAGSPLTPAAARAVAERVLPEGRARDWGQALMDLGSGTCVARVPRCHVCPIATSCAWLARPGRPDPARRAARASAPFEGSDRYHRGRLVEALRRSAVPRSALRAAAGLDTPARLERLVAGLVEDGLAEWSGDRLRLPAGS
jgi:A/G-specific adenine glycosylase